MNGYDLSKKNFHREKDWFRIPEIYELLKNDFPVKKVDISNWIEDGTIPETLYMKKTGGGHPFFKRDKLEKVIKIIGAQYGCEL